MRYRAWFAAKLAVAVVGLLGMVKFVTGLFPADDDPYAPLGKGMRFLLCDLALMLCFLMFCGALYLIVRDQRYRCRVCLRRLRMPVATGSWSRILQLGRPRIEYICTYGHGTLSEDDLRISGRSGAEWTPNSDDIWTELCAPGKDSERP